MSNNLDKIAKEAAKRKPKSRVEDLEIARTYGNQPNWAGVRNTDPEFDQMYARALNWANASFELEELKQFTIQWVGENNRERALQLQDVPAHAFGTIGKIAWTIINGCPITERTRDYVNGKLDALYSGAKVRIDDPVLVDNRTKNVMSRIREDVYDIIDKIDLGRNDNPVYNYLTANEISHKILPDVLIDINTRIDNLEKEIEDVSGLDADRIRDQFDDEISRSRYLECLESDVSRFTKAGDEINSYLGNKRALRKTRKGGKRPRNAEKIVKNVKFKLQDNEFKITSIPPAAVVGAQTLVTFNTKNRKLAVYVADNESGLSIKGTTIQNFNQKSSLQKTAKKPNQILKDLQNNSIARARVVFDKYMNTRPAEANGRINEHTILVRVFEQKF